MKGKVTQQKVENGFYKVLIDNEWYSQNEKYLRVFPQVGDEIEFENKNGFMQNLNVITKSNKPDISNSSMELVDENISDNTIFLRTQALIAATNVSDNNDEISDILDKAKQFERYLRGFSTPSPLDSLKAVECKGDEVIVEKTELKEEKILDKVKKENEEFVENINNSELDSNSEDVFDFDDDIPF